jgi:hypothetical protein
MQTALFSDAIPSPDAIMNYMEKTSASEVARRIKKDCRIIGLTRGQFSLIDLIYSTLQEVGPSDVVVATWSAGIKDANTVKWMCDTDLINNFLLLTDHSYKGRTAKYALQVEELFGAERIRCTRIHAKFVLIKSKDMFITIRTSMNLNANHACENFEIDEGGLIYKFYDDYVRGIVGEMPKGFDVSYSVVDRALRRTFDGLVDEFRWQSNE